MFKWFRKFGRQCERCRMLCDQSDIVMRAKNLVYHLQCFSCSTCNKQLLSGEYYIIRTNDIFCRPECIPPITIKEAQQLNNFNGTIIEYKKILNICDNFDPTFTNPNSSINCNAAINAFNGLRTSEDTNQCFNSVSKSESECNNSEFVMNNLNDSGRRTTHSSISTSSGTNSPYSNPDSVTAPSSTNSGSGGIIHNNSAASSSTSGSGLLFSKKTRKDKPAQRVRTVLNEGQLKILKHMYSTNQRPDTTIKEQLVEMTGLSARVIRVWFQNKRCKDKKRQNAIKELQRNQEKEQALHGVRSNGIGPLVANSPTALLPDQISSNSSLNGVVNPIDIRQYQQTPSLWEVEECNKSFQQHSQTHYLIHQNSTTMDKTIGGNNELSSVYSSIPIAYNSGARELPSQLLGNQMISEDNSISSSSIHDSYCPSSPSMLNDHNHLLTHKDPIE